MTAQRFSAKKWVEAEIDVMMDGYGNEETYAVQFVLEQLRSDEYRDELNDRQRDAAIAYLSTRK